MLRASITFGVVLSFMILMLPAHGSLPLHAQQPPAGVGRGGAPASPGRTPSIDERTSGMQKLDGYFPLYWDDRSGSVFIEIPRFDADFLFSTGLAAGLLSAAAAAASGGLLRRQRLRSMSGKHQDHEREYDGKTDGCS